MINRYITCPIVAIIVVICVTCNAEELLTGKKYKIIKPLYLSTWYDDLGNKTISKETARAYLNVTKNADRPYIAFQHEVPAGTVMTIIGLAPKPWYLYFNSDHYSVTLDPDMSQGLEVKLPLDSPLERGFGGPGGLNAEFFSRMQ